MLARADSDRVFQSYGRCCRNERFFEAFYRTFREKSEEIRAMFENTDMAEQRRLLRAGISWLIMYSRGAPGTKLQSLGESHNRHGYDVNPALYGYWVDALLETVEDFDPQFDSELGLQWREVLRPGIELISGAY